MKVFFLSKMTRIEFAFCNFAAKRKYKTENRCRFSLLCARMICARINPSPDTPKLLCGFGGDVGRYFFQFRVIIEVKYHKNYSQNARVLWFA